MNGPFIGNTTTNEFPKLDFDKVNKTIDDIVEKQKNMLIASFTGVRVEVDKELEGNNYYICVSQELYDLLKLKE